MYNAFAQKANTHEQWKILDKFDSTYWSGLDVQLYANNIALGEALQLSYIINEQVRPYYGYASYVADKIYHGTRLIQGEISLNFKRDGYIFSLLNLLAKQDKNDVWLPSAYRTNDARPDVNTPISYSNTPWGPQIWSAVANNELTPERLKAITQKMTAASEKVVNKVSPDISTRKGVFETGRDGFDLNIVFGGSLSSTQVLRAIEEGDYVLEAYREWDGFLMEQASEGIAASTGLKLIGVSIMNVARTVGDDGRPIIETYSFQAKDIVVLKHVGSADADPANPTQGKVKPPLADKKADINGAGTIGPTLDIPSSITQGEVRIL